ncbi:MAG: DUF1579 family protein [Planctomycetota bacterium]
MFFRIVCTVSFVLGLGISSFAQEPKEAPVELEVVKSSIGVWDAEVKVWMSGLDAPPTQFKGVETNKAFGKYWLSSDFDSEFMGQTTSVHSIVGYDLDKKKLVATIIDAGPYAASMTGDYDQATKCITWITKVKDANGKPLVQKTTVTLTKDDVRQLVLSVPDPDDAKKFIKFMEIEYTKRKK